MKQYDYIFHPDPAAQGEWTVEGMDLEHECVSRMIGPVICLTLEELREVWKEGMKNATMFLGGSVSFEQYIQSKGINNIIPMMTKKGILKQAALDNPIREKGLVVTYPALAVDAAMDQYAQQQAITFAEWMNEEDCQLTPDGWVRKKEDYKYYMPIQVLYMAFLSQQKQ